MSVKEPSWNSGEFQATPIPFFAILLNESHNSLTRTSFATMMKNAIIILLLFVSFKGNTQDESCTLSDGNYHYFVRLEDDVPIDFDKQDFITYLEINSSISVSDINFLQENLVEVYRSLPFLDSDPANKLLRIVASDHTLDSFLISLDASINQAVIYCDCLWSDGFYHYYVRLVIDDWPSLDFDKTDFINHIQTSSNPSNSDLMFLENSISEAYVAFPASQTDNRKTLYVKSNDDLMMPYLHDFPEALNLVELICDEPELSITDYQNPKDLISIVPNPIVETSVIKIDEKFPVEEIQIMDLNGKILFHKNVRGSDTVNMGEFNLNPGLYFIKFSERKSSIIKKILVK
ncbi:T9SS type A sorting domain-containing protein [Psychroserpens sp. XS_ASV72]|uniref:T9SS type A sorting domain-containing protein n=1 Tax=Psychroserpens sp. XS_ASV72 TaxID=3241293 RepID=UPI00351203BB